MRSVSPRISAWLWGGVVGLSAVAATYQIAGYYALATTRSDLDFRWREQQYFNHGHNPHAVYLVHDPAFEHLHYVSPSGNTELIEGVRFAPASRPPWGYVANWLLCFPARRWLVAWYAVLTTAAFVVIARWACRQVTSPAAGALLAVTVLALGGNSSALRLGQDGPIVTALLVLSLGADRRGRFVLSAICVSLALIKPTISIPFLGALVVTQRWRSLLVVFGYVIAASLHCWYVLSVDPLTLLKQLQLSAVFYQQTGTLGLMDLLLAVGVPDRFASLCALGTAALLGMAVMWRWCRHSLPLAYAVAATAGRLWSYHKPYDDIMLVFVLVPLAILVFERDCSRWLLAAFAAFVLTLVLPFKVHGGAPAWDIFQAATWVGATAVILAHRRELEPDPTALPDAGLVLGADREG